MSTVLEALRQSEGRGDPGSRRLPPGTSRRRFGPAAIAAVAILSGAAVALVFLARPETPPPVATETAPPVRSSAAVDVQPDLAVNQQRVPRTSGASREEAPWARVHEPRPAATARTAPQRQAKAEPERAAAPARLGTSESVAVPGGSQFVLDSIDCSAGRSACRARFLIDGRLVSLGAGERSGDIEVQLVLGDVAYVRQGGTVVALQAPR